MNDESNSHEGQGSATCASSKLSTKTRNDLKWNIHKDEIYQIYVEQNNTLRDTMQVIEGKHRFKASERKWKTKLKEWNFEKHLAANDLNILVAKKLKRSRDEEKETVFFHNGREIRPEKLENFKKRRISKLIEAQSLSADTPANIDYRTPSPGAPSFTERNLHESELNSRSERNIIEKSLLIPTLSYGDQEVIVTTEDSRDGIMVSISESHIYGNEKVGFEPVTSGSLGEPYFAPSVDLNKIDDELVGFGSLDLGWGAEPVAEGVSDERASYDQFGQSRLRLWPATLNEEEEAEKNESKDEHETNRMMSSSISALMSSGVNGAASVLGSMGSGMSSMSSKYGLTYSDISLSGISFNYSGLFPKRS